MILYFQFGKLWRQYFSFCIRRNSQREQFLSSVLVNVDKVAVKEQAGY